MNPIKCPNCEHEVLPHETHTQRLQECFGVVFEKFKHLTEDNQVKIALNLFNEINDFIISDNISKDKQKTTAQIQSYKRENIKKINANG